MKTIRTTNNTIDQLLQQRQDGLLDYARAMKQLTEMGVKISNPDGSVELDPSFQPYIDQYSRSGLEFEWMAEFDNKPPLHQFGPGPTEEHKFSEIDQSHLTKIHWISNFNWSTDNEEKRVIVTLDWKTGLFDFLNGLVPQEVKAEVSINPVTEPPKKLVLLMKRRTTGTMGDIDEGLKEFHPETNLTFLYNQFILGFETTDDTHFKRCIAIRPNGHVDLFEN